MASTSKLAAFTKFGKKIVCAGRNYAEHAAELNNPVLTTPLLFMKPPSCYLANGGTIEIPVGSNEVHHEIELGVVIGSTITRASPTEAFAAIGGYALVLDMTLREKQSELKKKGHPWELAKCFDTSLPVSEFIPITSIPDPHQIDLICKVNGEVRQHDSTSKMITRIPEMLSYISKYFTLEEGDLVITGTPKGVGPVKSGDTISGEIPGITQFSFSVAQRS